MYSTLTQVLTKHRAGFAPVVPFTAATDRIAPLDLTKNNTELAEDTYSNTALFSAYIDGKRAQAGAKYLIGGYGELREMYKRSRLFGFDNEMDKTNTAAAAEPRRLHLGIDVWGEAGTPITAPHGGMIHSLAYNDNFGDYGATIILQHQIDMVVFYTLYGHLSRRDLEAARQGQFITRGQRFAHIGPPAENGQWPPHLHFQVIEDIGYMQGDYPGVCKYSEKEKYLTNCPDADLLLNMNRFLPAVH
jgi:peptidoglycan LD-endopeptidase LytH